MVNVFIGRKGKKEINGLTKLAKLDFYLRYPAILERSLRIVGEDPDKVGMKSYERDSIESKMVRFKYGPWDFRYRILLSIMIAKGLINLRITKRTHFISLTEKGRDFSKKISEQPVFSDYVCRSRILKKHFDRNGTWLKNFIYRNFPEILDLKYGVKIDYGIF